MKNGRTGGILVRILLYFTIIILLFGGALAYVAHNFDPKDFNLDIQAMLSRYLGRQFTINGPMSFSYFPWLGVVADDVEVQQPEGFGDTPFVRIKRLQIRIRLMPLITDRQVVLGRLVLEEPSLLLIKDKQGNGNWKGWAFLQDTPPDSSSGSSEETPFTIESLSSQGVGIHNGKLVWDSRTSGNYYEVTGIELSTDAGLHFDYTLFCNYFSKKDTIKGFLKAKGEGLVRTELHELDLQNSDVEFSASVGNNGGTRDYLLKGHGSMLVLSEVARLKNVSLKLNEATLEGSLQGSQVFSDDIAISGKVRTHDPNIDALLGPDPAPVARTLLHKASASANYSLKDNVLTLANLNADLSGTRVTGLVGLDFSKVQGPTRWSADCAVDTLDLDRLFPEKATRSDAAPAAKKAVVPGETLDQLRTLEMDLKLRAKKLIWRQKNLAGANLRLHTSKGRVRLKTKASNFCRGALDADFQSGKKKRSLRLAFSGVDAAELMQLINTPLSLTGKGNISLNADFSGNSLGQLAASLQARLHAELTGGSVASASTPDSIWPFSSLKYELEAKAAASDKNVVKPFAVKSKVQYKGLPPWLQAPRKNAKEPVKPVFEGLPESSLKADIRGRARFSLADMVLRNIDNAATRVSYTGHTGDGLNYRKISTEGSGRLSCDFLFDTLEVQKAAFTALGFAFQGDTHCTGLAGPADKRIFTGNISVSSAKPRAALRTFLIELPTPRSPNVYRNWKLRTSYQLDQDALECDNMLLRLDKSTIKGKIGVFGLSKKNTPPFINFDLVADKLPLDAYRPLEKKHAPGVAPKVENWNPEQIRKLNLDGKLFAADVQLYGLRAKNLRARVKAAQGRLELRSLKSRFYKGDLDGALTVEAPQQSDKLLFTTECKASAFQAGSMLNALGADNDVTGTANLQIRLAGAGRNFKESLATLGGRLAFAVRDGSVIIKRAKASAPVRSTTRQKRRRKEPLFHPKKNTSRTAKTTRTSFDSARGVFNIAQGIMRNKDFLMQSTLVQAQGEGVVNLPRELIDYTITIQMTGAPSIPIRISGPLKDPGVTMTHGIITDTAERIGGSIFDVFEGIYTLPFKAYELIR